VLAHNGGAEDAIVGHLATLLRPGGCLYLVDVDVTAARFVPEDPDIMDLMDRYAAFHTSLGNDMRAGLRLGERLARADLDVVEFRGRYTIMSVPQGMRGPAWAAREALLSAGVATTDDIARWEAAHTRLDQASQRPTGFIPSFVAIGQKAPSAA
jgi:hypothetical protein